MRSKGQTLDKALVINLQRVFLQEDTMLLQDRLDLKLKYGIIRFREDVCDWVKEKNAFKPAFCRNYVWTNADGEFVNIIFTSVRECIWISLSVISYLI